ncbi:hypothetical protein [Listeria monocytogenes]|nr:hypothetical protein [Listeria monocytogenes]EJN4467369.1 hypothetical protein [Listeria monocytogenes]ELU8200283.1 hypothetical protein [Listeria monocytogenes]
MMKKIKNYFFVIDESNEFTKSDIIALIILAIIVAIGIGVNLAVWL